MFKRRTTFGIVTLLIFVFAAQVAHSYKTGSLGDQISRSAGEFVKSLYDAQKEKAILPADSPLILGWHFIPMDKRKGLEVNEMTSVQRNAGHELLKSVLSEAGYSKATGIMRLETLLKELQDRNGGQGPIRDPLRYYFTLFGDPTTSERWGLSVEGHHLSLNFVIQGDEVISSTPQFFATNPATVRSENSVGVPLGTRILRIEETAAFELVNTLSKEQRAVAIIAEQAPQEIRAAGEPQPPQTAPEGIAWAALSPRQQVLLRRVVREYVGAVPEPAAENRLKGINFEEVYFAWAGSLVPHVGHYYRIQGPTFLIEFVNTQPDADGNPANHIHSVWRDMRGDFGRPIGS